MCMVADIEALSTHHFTSTVVRLGFLPLVAVWLGKLSELEQAQRERSERLNVRLRNALERTRAMQKKLRHADRLAAAGKIAAQLAHQIKNPLGSVALNVEMLQDELRTSGELDADEADELLTSVQNELELLTELTENYLRFARLPKLNPVSTDVNELLGELVGFLEAEMSRENIRVTAALSERVGALPLDGKQLRLAIANLMRNSLEAIEEGGGRLHVATTADNGSVCIEISDTGGGIASEDEDKVFEMFYSTKSRGSGLGLTMTKKIVEDHGGEVTCRSVTGAGTTFTIRLPAGDGNRAPPINADEREGAC